MDSPEIVLPPNPNKGKEITQLVSFKSLPKRQLAAQQARLKSFSVLGRPGNKLVRDGKTYEVPKKYALIRKGWDGVTDPEEIAAYQRNVDVLLKKPSKQK